MNKLKILSWNVNGVRSVLRKGFLEWLYRESPDILCVQETKALPEQLGSDLLEPHGYHSYWNSAERKGYSGVATFTKEKPLKVQNGLGINEFDVEGRVIATEYPGFSLFNIYFPKGETGTDRLKYKMDFYDAFLQFVDYRNTQGEKLIICGDFNTAHKEIDIARPKENEKVSGFLPEERAWIDKFISHGYIDTFRHFNSEPNHYTWWDYKTKARERNIGWRLDYFFVTENLLGSVTEAFIMADVMYSEIAPGEMYSDHCPVGITLEIS